MINWLKNAFFKGLIVLIPIVLLWIALRELVELLISFAGPIADMLPAGLTNWVENPALVAPILIFLIALTLGIFASIPVVRKTGVFLERNTLGHLPIYRMIKTFVSAFLEVEDASSFRPALIMDDEGGAEPCYVIEDTPDNPNVVVLVPWSPASFAGAVKLIPRKRIRRLDLSLDEFSLSLANFGLGMNSILNFGGPAEGSRKD